MFKRIKAFLTAPEPDPIATASLALFSATSDAFDAAYASCQTHTTRANRRYNILMASRSPHDANAYDEKIAGYTDPADFAPYTEAELDAHSAAIESLNTAFDRLTAAFSALSCTDHLYKSAAAVYKATTELFVFATNAYQQSARCAMTTALESKIQAVSDEFEVMLLQLRAANAAPTDAPAANAKAAAYKANATKNAAVAKSLEEKATAVDARADVLRVKASSAADNAREVVNDSQ
jgi:hypothetical protein